MSRFSSNLPLPPRGLVGSAGLGWLGAAAAGIGAAALVNHLVAKRSERRHPPRGHFVTVDGVRLHYLAAGRGDPIVLLHGNGTMAEDWVVSGVFQELARHHRVIAFDRPGFGFSERPRDRIWTAGAQATVLRKALRQLGVAKPTLVGHSWGTLVALTMALQDQEDTAALVLLSGYYNPTLRKDVFLGSGPAIPVLGDLMRYTISPVLGWLLSPLVFRKLFAPQKITKRFRQLFPTALALRPSQLRATAGDTALMVPGAFATFRRHDELALPVTVMAGTQDAIASFKGQAQRLRRETPGSALRAIGGGGHMIHHTAPDLVARVISGARTESVPQAA